MRKLLRAHLVGFYRYMIVCSTWMKSLERRTRSSSRVTRMEQGVEGMQGRDELDETLKPWDASSHQETLVHAANLIVDADALLIGAGAGASVDSGVPDFRGEEGFWRMYPPARERGFCYEDVAGGPWFSDDPEMAWGFIVHCQRLFEGREPHEGYHILKRWSDVKETSWVYTSNVDRYFYRAGFAPHRITEIHGFRDVLQCVTPCTRKTWTQDLLDEERFQLDEESLRLEPDAIPRCPHCGELARPNSLMFNDHKWIGDATREQEERLTTWLNEQLDEERKVAVIEIGAGSAVPSVRFQCERYARAYNTPLIRINPGEPDGPDGALSLPMPALAALRAINALILQKERS